MEHYLMILIVTKEGAAHFCTPDDALVVRNILSCL
jgi:hypothetical protein